MKLWVEFPILFLEFPPPQKKYIGRAGRTLESKYKEYIHATKNNRPNTGYSRYILDTEHTFDSTENTMAIIRKTRKGKLLKNFEKQYTLQMNELNVDHNNPTFETIYQKLQKSTWQHINHAHS
jgi:hypothetical protein